MMLPSGTEISSIMGDGSAFVADGESFFSAGETGATRMPS